MNDRLQFNAEERFVSLDVMRGLTIGAMILVNYPGSEQFIYEPLKHAQWDGLTPTDLIFPFFLFMIGMSITLSFTKLLAKGVSKKELHKKIILRSFKIFAVGLILHLLPSFNIFELQITGVFQRLATVFLACAFIYLYFPYKTQIWLGAFILVAYWLVMTTIPTPGFGKVMLERNANLALWLDSVLLPGFIWKGRWDAEGILGAFPSIVTGISGLLAGQLLIGKRSSHEKVILLMVYGLASATIGYVWSLLFPVNKNLWSSSYVLVSSGFASLVLGAIYYVVDIRKYTVGTTPAVIFGTNAIASYFIADVISYIFFLIPFGSVALNEHFMASVTAVGLTPKFVGLIYSMLFVSLNYGIAYVLYRRKIFIKL